MIKEITVESLREEINYLESLKRGFIKSSARRQAIRTQKTINFKKKKLMELSKEGR